MVAPPFWTEVVKTVEKPESIGRRFERALMTPTARTAGAAAILLDILLYYLGEIG